MRVVLIRTVDVVVLVVRADQPLERRIRVRREPHFLAEGLRCLGLEYERVDDRRRIVEADLVVAPLGLGIAVGADRGQRRVRDAVPVDAEARADRAALHVLCLRAHVLALAEAVGGAERAERADAGDGRIVDRRANRAVALVFAVLDRQQRPQLVVGMTELQLRARLVGLQIVEVAIQQHVAVVTGAIAHLEREARRDVLGEAAGQVAVRHEAVVITVGNRGRAARRVAGLRGDDAERAADDILAEQHALRAADDFDPIEIEEVGERRAHARDVHLVDEQADRGFCGRIVELHADDAADVELLGDRRVLRHVDPGHARRERVQVGDAVCYERVGADGADRDRHVLQALLALLRGDDDFFERGPGRSGVAGRSIGAQGSSD